MNQFLGGLVNRMRNIGIDTLSVKRTVTKDRDGLLVVISNTFSVMRIL